ncbi:hypothetical protein FRB95_007809 [Tulasnella sp. JGI-2019a]|nr:hypothetical protein FRB95_007809 [Tulasnella sp. JGI-2019a]
MHEDSEHMGRKMLVQRPFIVYFFVASEWRYVLIPSPHHSMQGNMTLKQYSGDRIYSALELWKLDSSLLFAVEVALTFQRLIDWYQRIWPSAEIQRWTANAASELRSICELLGKDI